MTSKILPRFDEKTESLGPSGMGALRSPFGNLPLKTLAHNVRVLGLSIRSTITQTFFNPFDEAIEAVYIFPVEGDQAVTACEMWVADRMIRAKLKERGAARAAYDQAIQLGQRAAMLEEDRPETFSMKVGNIPPGESIQIRIETVGQLQVVQGEWSLRIPLVVAPRYTSGFPLPGSPVGKGVAQDSDEVPDASCVTPPTSLPGFGSPVDLRLEAEIDMNSVTNDPHWIQQISSSLHSVFIDADSDEHGVAPIARIRLQPGERINRDFILRGQINDSETQASLTIEPPPLSTTGDSNAATAADRNASLATFALNIVSPRSLCQKPKDVVFLLDRSGSMSGWKMSAARRGIGRLVDTLSNQDRFQVIAFDHTIDAFQGNLERSDGAFNQKNSSSKWFSATDTNRFDAIGWLTHIQSEGGTDIGLAIKAALSALTPPNGPSESDRKTAIVLVTDGQITGEDGLLRLLGDFPEANRPRMYCLGIDRAVNGSLIKRLTKFAGGTYELVESEKRLDEVLRRFGNEIGGPSIKDLRIFKASNGEPQADLQLAPSNIRDLCQGRSVSIYGRVQPNHPLTLKLEGQLANGEPWQQEVTTDSSVIRKEAQAVLGPLWGQRRLRELEDRFVSGASREQNIKQEIIECSLGTQVLSRLTAFIAIDKSQRVTDGGPIHSINQPVESPEGWLQPISSGDLISPPSVDNSKSFQEHSDTDHYSYGADFSTPGGVRYMSANPSQGIDCRDNLDGAFPPLLPDAYDSSADEFVAPGYLSANDETSFFECRVHSEVSFDDTLDWGRNSSSSDSEIDRLITLLLKEAIQLEASHIIIRRESDRTAVTYIIDEQEHERDFLHDLQLDEIQLQFEQMTNRPDVGKQRLQSWEFNFSIEGRKQHFKINVSTRQDSNSILILVSTTDDFRGEEPDAVKKWWLDQKKAQAF